MSSEQTYNKQTEKRWGLGFFIAMLIAFLVVVGVWIGFRLNPSFGDATAREWLDWILAGLAGALLYTIISVAHWYQRSRPRFKDFSLWYLSTILKGPVLAFIILLFLKTVDIEVAGITIDFTALDENALLVAAFLLGFYNRVARETLNQITKSIFGKAYGRAEEQFNIKPKGTQVIFEKNHSFKLSRAVDVTWLASLGKIDDAGLYTAPASSTQLSSGAVDQITAVPKDPNIPRATATVTLRNFEILGDRNLDYGGSTTYTVSSGTVGWNATTGTVDTAGKFTAPAKANVPGVDSVTITAVDTNNPNDLATLQVYLKD